MITNELYDIIHAGDLRGTREWLAKNPDDLNAFISDGYTPLHVACIFGREDIAALLIGREALVNINADNDSRATALHLAVTYREEDVARRIAEDLVDHGAELNGVQAGGQTPLHHAVARGSAVLVSYLIDAGADPFLEDDQGRSPAELARALSAEQDGERIRAELKRAFSLPLETRE